MTKKLQISLVFMVSMAVLLASSHSWAGPRSVLGGKSMGGGTAHHVAVGWPSVGYEWWRAGNPDWAMGAEIVYGDWSGSHSNAEIGLGLNVPIKWGLTRQDVFDVAFRLAPGVLLANWERGPIDRFMFGARIELGVPITINLHERVNLLTGVNVPLSFYVIEDIDPYVVVPILGRIGAEVVATPAITPWFMAELGPGIAFGDFGTDVDFAVRVWFGVTFF